MINQLLIAQPPIQVMPALAEAVGFNEAAVLQIIHYWLSPTINQHFKDNCYWAQNLRFHLRGRFFFWDEDTIGYMIAQFEQSGILIMREATTSDGVPLTYHTINYERLEQMHPAPTPLVPDAPLEEANSNIRPTFKAEIVEKGHNLYVLTVEEPGHFLACELTLEIQEKIGGETEEAIAREAVCHFPRINDKKFRKLVWNDATLYRILMDAFHMRIMKQFLMFCVNHDAARLIIFADDAQVAESYRMFLSYGNQTPTARAEGTGLVIPTDREAFDVWTEFMAGADVKLQQTLWRERKGNPAIENYLQSLERPET